jgi:hypothetical protein
MICQMYLPQMLAPIQPPEGARPGARPSPARLRRVPGTVYGSVYLYYMLVCWLAVVAFSDSPGFCEDTALAPTPSLGTSFKTTPPSSLMTPPSSLMASPVFHINPSTSTPAPAPAGTEARPDDASVGAAPGPGTLVFGTLGGRTAGRHQGAGRKHRYEGTCAQAATKPTCGRAAGGSCFWNDAEACSMHVHHPCRLQTLLEFNFMYLDTVSSFQPFT